MSSTNIELSTVERSTHEQHHSSKSIATPNSSNVKRGAKYKNKKRPKRRNFTAKRWYE